VQTWRNVRTVLNVRVVNKVLHDLLGHVQTLAILLAALIAADFFVFTPTVTSTVVQEYRVSASSVTDAYTAAGVQVPPVVLTTLADLTSRSIPIGQSATVVNSGPSTSASSQTAPASSGAAAPLPATSGVYPMAEICAKSRATVEAVFAGACTIGLQLDLPLYDRALFHFDEEAGSPLDPGQLHDAIARLTMAVFARATVTLSNPGKATAQNVNIIVPDGYARKTGSLPLSLNAAEKSDFRFESQPGALASTQGAIVTNPTFTVKWDPTGPLDPQFSLRIVLGFALLLALMVVLDTIEAVRDEDGGSDAVPAT
jgi:hypothetical protein